MGGWGRGLKMDKTGTFSTIFKNGNNFLSTCLFPCTPTLSEKESTQIQKNLLATGATMWSSEASMRAHSFLLE